MASYLELHPQEAHELMVPSGFKQCFVRKLERYLSNTQPVSTQDGTLELAYTKAHIFDTALPGEPKVVHNPHNKPAPSWRTLNSLLCKDLYDTLGADCVAPEYEDSKTGERFRLLSLKGMRSTVSSAWQPRTY